MRQLRLVRLLHVQRTAHREQLAEARTLSCQCRPETGVDLVGGFLLHAGSHVRVRVEGDPDGSVTEAHGDDLGMHAGLEELGRVRVAQVVETALDLPTGRRSPRRPRSRGVCWAFASRCQTAPDSLRKDEA